MWSVFGSLNTPQMRSSRIVGPVITMYSCQQNVSEPWATQLTVASVLSHLEGTCPGSSYCLRVPGSLSCLLWLQACLLTLLAHDFNVYLLEISSCHTLNLQADLRYLYSLYIITARFVQLVAWDLQGTTPHLVTPGFLRP